MLDEDEIQVEEDEVDTGAWMDTYADAITLLMCFFVLLYATSTPDKEKLSQLASALQSELSGRPYVVEELLDGNIHMGLGEVSEYDALVEKVGTAIDEQGLSGLVEMRLEEEGVVLQLGDSSLFDSGKADLKPESKEILDKIAIILKDIDKKVTVDGHTDNIPVSFSSEFRSNWELSLYRALNVLDYLIATGDLDVSKYSATGNGEYNPLVPNDSYENRSINRRVDILIEQPKK